MNDIDEIISTARRWAPMKMALATVTETWGSAPRPRGGHLLIGADGRFAGSISGGCVEYDVFALAEQVIAGAPATLRHYGVSDESAWQAGLPCGGRISVFVQRVEAGHFAPELIERIAQTQAAGQSLDLSTDLVTGLTVEGVREGQFVNHYAPARRLLIVGAVQIAQALASIAQAVGFAVTINDPRERFLTTERFPGVILSDAWPDEAVAAFAPNSQSAVVTLSHDIKIDDPALIAALAAPTGYVGALGSRANHVRRVERLGALGVAASDLARIDGPAGLRIGGLGPQEIALSIAAGMVGRLRGHH